MCERKKIDFCIAIQFSVSLEFFQNYRVSLLCAVWPQDWPQDFLPNPIDNNRHKLFAQPAVCYALMTLSLLQEELLPKCEREGKKNRFLDRDPIFNEFVTVNGPYVTERKNKETSALSIPVSG